MIRPFLHLVLFFLFYFAGLTQAIANDDFYKGKTIRIIVGFSAGGGFDIYARLIARHLDKHLPGVSSIIVENMPGAGSLTAANHLYNRVEPDGLTIGTHLSSFVLLQALGDKTILFDVRNIGWLGSPINDTPACAIMGFTGLNNLDDIRKSGKTLKMGGLRAGATNELPKILNMTLGTKFRVIAGYKGTSDVRLAMQTKEVDGACWSWESMKATATSMLEAKGDEKLTPFLIHRKVDDPELKGVPLIRDVIKDKDGLAVYRAWVAPYEFFRPFTVPPGTPKQKLNLLRKAFASTMTDPEFLADAKRSQQVIHYVSPEEIDAYVNELMAMPDKVKEQLRSLLLK